MIPGNSLLAQSVQNNRDTPLAIAMTDNPYRKKMEQKNKTQLLRIINNKHQFRPQAVEAAKEVLQARNTGENKQRLSSSSFTDNQKEASASKEEKKISPQFSLRAIATYQLLSALLIMPKITRAYPQIISSSKNTAILVFFTLLYLMGLVSAIFIFRKKYIGVITGLIYNFFQCFYIQLSAFGYYSSGIFTLIYILPSRLKLSIGPTFAMSFYETGVWNIGFNMIACFIFLLLLTAETNFREKGQFPEHLY